VRFPARSVYFVGEPIFCYNRVCFAPKIFFCYVMLVYYGSKSEIFNEFLIRMDFTPNKMFLLHRYIIEAKRGLREVDGHMSL
jgi:hypothetical protein